MTETMKKKGMPSITIEIDTPDGVLYTTIIEDDEGTPTRVQAVIGKAGLSVTAWSYALSSAITALLEKGVGVNDIINFLSSQTSSSRPRVLPDGIKVRSGPEGICVALMKYRHIKFQQLRATLDGEDYDEFSGPRING